MPSVPVRPPSSRVPGDIACALIASLWVFAFAPRAEVWAVAPGVVGMLAILERARTTRRAVLYVLLFGTIAIGFGYRWLADTVRVFGELDLRVGGAAGLVSWLVLVAYGVWSTVHIVLFAVLYRRTLHDDRRPHPLATAALFVACEVLPVRFLAWQAGYGAVESAPLRQVAEWGGVPLVSFALLCFAVPLHEGLRWVIARDDGPRPRAGASLLTVAVGLLLYGVGWWRLGVVADEDRHAPASVRVGLVQAHVGSTAKRAAERGDRGAEGRAAYERGTRAAAAAGAELIVWPETALVEGARLWDARAHRLLPKATIDGHLARLGYGFLAEVGADRTLLLGGYADEVRDGATVRFNVAMLREPGGASWGIYRKVKLMPFGERIPGQDAIESLRGLLPQAVPMSAGERDQPPLRWRARDLDVCAFVCYESIVPGLVASLAGERRPDLLVNLTNDSWYGDTWEPHQHLAFARLRAVEHRTPMLRATNTGISALVDATGEVTDRLGWGREGVVIGDVPLVSRPRTLYAATASMQPWVWWAAAVLLLALRRRRA
ncbi:MAG: apolipoprotein N-acyltransferase [Planctomycetia bacterium]|nr:apolipoprotein N-acyltransferase [Planctomycetia bacterium]